MDVQRIAAFSLGSNGGNPAGVVLLDKAVNDEEMARVAAEVGYSETVFAVVQDDTKKRWRARYFAPESEVPFCGHATIALGAALGEAFGEGTYALKLNDAEISVEAEATPDGMVATLSSPPTMSHDMSDAAFQAFMALFDLTDEDLDPRLPPAFIHAGANHIMLCLKDRARLASMTYDLDQGQKAMRAHDVVTVMLVCIKDDQSFDVRNAFASGGVLEDPATGAAAAAFAGYLRDRNWLHGGKLEIQQGEDMGSPSRIYVTLNDTKGASVQVSGRTRKIV